MMLEFEITAESDTGTSWLGLEPAVEERRTSTSSLSTADKSLQWFRHLQHRYSSDSNVLLSMRHQLSIFLGFWICEIGLKVDSNATLSRQLGRKIQQDLESRSEPVAIAELKSFDSSLVILTAVLFDILGLSSGRLDHFLDKLSDFLQSERESNDDSLFIPKLLLSQTGRREIAPETRSSPIEEWWPERTLEFSRQEIEMTCQQLSIETLFGSCALKGNTDKLEEVGTILSVWALYMLRRYDLALGAEILRSMVYTNLVDTRTINQCIDFLKSQQHPDGRFGFFPPRRPERGNSKSEDQEVLEVFLPLNVVCLRALAETQNPDFRLFLPQRFSVAESVTFEI